MEQAISTVSAKASASFDTLLPFWWWDGSAVQVDAEQGIELATERWSTCFEDV
jgi:hypothetical protein